MWMFDTTGFVPRWTCGKWSELLGWTHISSDVLIFLAYVAIPFSILYFMYKQREVIHPSILLLFSVFIFSCGTVHLIEAIIFWQPYYRASAVLKVITAIASILTVLVLIKFLPKALRVPSIIELNEKLESELEFHKEAEIEIMENVRAREKALADNKQLASLVESSIDSIYSTDLDGIIISWNKSAERLFGYTAEEIIGQSVMALVPENMRRERNEIIERIIQNRESFIQDTKRMRKDGRLIDISLSIFPVYNDNGKVVSLSTISRDISDRITYEKELLRVNTEIQSINMKLAASNDELSQFAYVASHDLQAPLRAINGFAQFLEQEYATQLDDKARGYINRITTNTQRMQSLINDLLSYARSDGKNINYERLDLNLLLSEITVNLDSIIQEKKCKLEISDLPSIYGDKLMLTQLLENLISNAMKYNQSFSPLIKIDAKLDNGFWVISVADNGIGIDTENKEEIFKIFRRLHKSEEFSGTGLGLAICKQIVNKHGGKIWVESTVGSGSTFYFSIPAKEQSNGGNNGR